MKEPKLNMEAAALEFALWRWGADYAAQTKSAADWWAEQDAHRKRTAADAANMIVKRALGLRP